MNNHSQFVSGIRWVAAGKLTAQLASWAGTIFVMRTLAPQDYGLAAICSAIIGAISILAEFGISAGLVQARERSAWQIRSVFGASLLISFTCAGLVVMVAPLLAAFFNSPEATVLIRVSALHLVLAPLAAVPDAEIRRALRFRDISIVDFCGILAATISTVVLAINGRGVWALVLGPLTGTAARVVLLHAFAPNRVLPVIDFAAARDLVSYGAKIATSRVAGYVFGQSDIWIAGRMLGKAQLGEYAVAMQLSMLPMSKIMGIVNEVAFPVIAKMNRDGEDVRGALLGGLRLLLYTVTPLLWGLAITAADLVPLLLGTRWLGAVPVLQIVCLVLPIRLISVLMSSMLQGTGRAALDLKNMITGALLLPVCFLVGANYGAIGLAWAWALGLPLVVVANLLRSQAALKVTIGDVARAASLPWLFGLGLLGAGLVCRGMLQGSVPSWVSLVLTATAAATTYLSLLWVFDRASARKLLEVVRLRRR